MTGNDKLIKSLYKRFRRRTSSLDQRRLDLLCDNIIDRRGLELNDDRIVFSAMPANAPLRSIRLDHIRGVAEVEQYLAIVLHSSIIFFNRATLQIAVHIKPPTLLERVTNLFR